MGRDMEAASGGEREDEDDALARDLLRLVRHPDFAEIYKFGDGLIWIRLVCVRNNRHESPILQAAVAAAFKALSSQEPPHG